MSAEGKHIKKPEAAARAENRKKNEGQKTKQQRMGSAMSMPTLDEKLKRFNGIVRHIMRREADSGQSKWFKAERRDKLRRLAKLGTVGHQPAIAAYCEVRKEGRDVIIESLVATPKA